MRSLRGSQIDVGDSVYDEKTEKFHLVIARHSEQGSGPTPSRTWVAYEGNPRIQELDYDTHYVVKRSTPKHEDPATGEEQDSRKFPVVCQAWEESERGWGVRPDGYSVHLSMEDHAAWVKTLEEGRPKEAPHEYSRPSGGPFLHEVSSEIHAELVEAKKRPGNHGISVLQCYAGKLNIPRNR